MTSLLERGRTESRAGSKPTERLPSRRNVRKPVLAVASAGLIFVSIAAFASLYSRAAKASPVIAVVQPVALGAVISPGDLGEADVSSSGVVSPMPMSALPSVIGRRASVALVPGTLLTAADVSSANGIRKGEAVVGLSLRANQLPADGVEAGDTVMVVQSGSVGTGAGAVTSAAASTNPNSPTGGQQSIAGSTTASTLVPSALVYDVSTPPANSPDGAILLVSIETSIELAPGVAAEAAGGDVSLVLLPGGAS